MDPWQLAVNAFKAGNLFAGLSIVFPPTNPTMLTPLGMVVGWHGQGRFATLAFVREGYTMISLAIGTPHSGRDYVFSITDNVHAIGTFLDRFMREEWSPGDEPPEWLVPIEVLKQQTTDRESIN